MSAESCPKASDRTPRALELGIEKQRRDVRMAPVCALANVALTAHRPGVDQVLQDGQVAYARFLSNFLLCAHFLKRGGTGELVCSLSRRVPLGAPHRSGHGVYELVRSFRPGRSLEERGVVPCNSNRPTVPRSWRESQAHRSKELC